VTVALNDEKLRADYEPLLQAFKQSPQVLDSTVSYHHPLRISWGMGMSWAGEEQSQFVRLGPVDFNYIDFYGLKVKRGRKMTEEMGTDRAEAVLLNETAVRASPWEDPIGKRCQVDGHEGVVIGIVEDFHFKSLYNQVEPLALRHLYKGGLVSGAGYISLKISSYDIPGTLKYLEDTWEKFSSYFPFQYAFLDATIDSVYRTEIRLSRSLTSFTVIAIFLACLGLFGLTSFTAQRRTKEIGIRKVLGASPKGIFLMLSKDIVKWVILATIVAFPLAYYAMHEWLKRFAYRIDIGMGTFALATAFSLLIAILAMSYQSVKAATANPVDSLRYE
jgi:putative ABC transport system permease protein